MGAQKPANTPVPWLKEIFLAMCLNLIWVLLALLAVWLGWRSYTLSANGSTTQGIIVELLEDETAFDSDFSPVVEFRVDGKTYTVQSQNNYPWWNRYTRFPIGGQVEMLYDPGNPASAEINSWFDIWTEPLLLGVFTAFAAIAINLYLLFRWRSRRNVPVSA